MNQINLILQRSISQANNRIEQTLHRLATGMKINSPADDPVGFTLSTNLNSEIRALAQAMQNTQNGINMLYAGIDSLQSMESILLKLKELTEKAASGTYSGAERQKMQKQANELLKSLYTTKNTTSFGQINIFGSKLGAVPTTSYSNISVESYVNYAAFMYNTPSSVGSATNDGSGYNSYQIAQSTTSSTQSLSESSPASTVLNVDTSTTVYISSAQEFIDKISLDGSGTEGVTYILDGDIDFTGILSVTYETKRNFAGTLVGNGHTIKNLTSSKGLFSSTTETALIENLTLENFNISASSSVGTLVSNNRGTIDNVHVNNSTVMSTSQQIGGLVALNYGNISNSSAEDINVVGGSYVGGLVGQNTSGNISDSYVTGTVSGNSNVGGFVGTHSSIGAGVITNSYSMASVTGSNIVGGFVGNISNAGGSITNSYSMGAVTGKTDGVGYVGGFIGELESGTLSKVYSYGEVNSTLANTGAFVGTVSGGSISDSFYNKSLAGISNASGSGSVTGVTGLTNSQFAMSSPFTNAGWSETVWDFTIDGPHLIWENYTPAPTEIHISSAQEFIDKISQDGSGTEGKIYILDNDIDFAGIADYVSKENFAGTLVGNGHTIKNLSANGGLFNSTTSTAEIEDVNIQNFDIIVNHNNTGLLVNTNFGKVDNVHITSSTIDGSSSYENIGGMIGRNEVSAVISNSSASVNITGSFDNTGGLIGYNIGSIDNSSSSGTISGHDDVGGLVGYNWGTVNNSSSSSIVSGNNDIGGLIGGLTGIVKNSHYTSGTVNGNENVGGLVGWNNGDISNSGSYGDVDGNIAVGGLIGWNDKTVTGSFSSADVEGEKQVGGFVGSNTGTISGGRSSGTVIGTASIETSAGGFAGFNCGTISSSNSTGNVSGVEVVGGFVADNDGNILNSYATGDVSGNRVLGGFVGYIGTGGSISKSYAKGSVSGAETIGGFVGSNAYGNITESYSEGSVTGGYLIGGFAGFNNSVISESYSIGSVTGTAGGTGNIGGFVGYTAGSGNISNVYSYGAVNSNLSKTGAFAGTVVGGAISNSFLNTTATSISSVVGNGNSTGITGITDGEFLDMNKFSDAGWDDTIWNLTDGNTRPHLIWENYLTPGVTPGGDEGDPDFDGYPDIPDGSYPIDSGNNDAKTEVILQIGPDNEDSSHWGIDTSLDFQNIWINLSNSDTSKLSLDSIDNAISVVQDKIAYFTNTIDILESMIDANKSKSENFEAAKSTIMDADIATEMVELMKAKKQFNLSNTMLIQAGNIQYNQAMTLINGLNFASSGQEVQNSLNTIQDNGNKHQSILDAIQDNKISHQSVLNSIQSNNIYHQSILDVVVGNNSKNNIILRMINK